MLTRLKCLLAISKGTEELEKFTACYLHTTYPEQSMDNRTNIFWIAGCLTFLFFNIIAYMYICVCMYKYVHV